MSGLDAIVVGARDLGDNDRVVTLLSAERGRVDAVARGARSSRRRFGGALDPGTRLFVTFERSRGRLPLLGEPTVRSAPNRSREDLGRLAHLLYGCELCAALAAEESPADKLFGLLDAWLGVCEAPVPPASAARVALEAKALTFAGLAPWLERCGQCHEPIEDPAVFAASAEGAFHARCGPGEAVPAATLVNIARLLRTPMAGLAGLRFDGPPWLLLGFARYHLGRDLRSAALLADLGDPP